MARARSGGGSGSAWALVFFGAGFFISLLLAIVFYTQVSGARQGEEAAEKKLAEFATPSEQSSPDIDALKAGTGSVVGALIQERNALRTLIANDPGKSQEEIKAASAQLGLAEGRTLFAELSRLQNEVSGLQELNNTLKQDLAKASQRADAAETAKAELDQSYKDSLANLEATVDQTGDALKATQDKIQAQKSTLDGQMADTRSGYISQIAGLEDNISERDTEIRRLLKIIDELSGGSEQDPGPSNLTRADGRIVSVIGGRPEVYISLGRGDRLQMGMTFEVFDSNDLVKLNEYQQVRGKATIEVVSVDEAASVARIVRLDRGQAVGDNDQIVNLAYDPDAILKFYVYGDFDIDGDGVANAEDRDQIISKIRQWDGQVADALTYDVDFLVLGAEPPLPTPPPEGEVDPVKIAKYVAEQREFETYQQLIGDARSASLNIPILNQNRFLALVGHYDR